jgi:RND superfamily putative drug exporter
VVLLSRAMDMAEFAINVCSLVGLGVAIDYSLFTVSRYREELAAGATLEAALHKAVSTAGRMVAFSGMAVATGMSGLLFFHGCFLEALGIGGAVVVALAVVFALTFLPALLAVLGDRIHAGRLPFIPETSQPRVWRAVAEWVMKRPIQVLVPTLALLVLMGTPFLRLELALADVRVLNAAVEARRGDTLLREHFAALAANRLILAVEFPSAPALDPARIGALYDLSRRLAKLPHVVGVQSVVDAPGEQPSRASYQELLLHPPPAYAAELEAAKKLLVKDNVALLYVLTDGNPEDDTSRDVVREVRRDPRVADGSFLVGGLTALDLDVSTFILARAPYAIAWVVGAMLIVLLLLLGSIVLPFKAVAMNFVSLPARSARWCGSSRTATCSSTSRGPSRRRCPSCSSACSSGCRWTTRCSCSRA